MSNFEEERKNYLLKFCHNTVIFQSLIKSNNQYNKEIAYILMSRISELELKFANSVIDFEHDVMEIGSALEENRLQIQSLDENKGLNAFIIALKKVIHLLGEQDALDFKKIAEELGYTGVDNIDYQILAQYAFDILLAYSSYSFNDIISYILKNLGYSNSTENVTKTITGLVASKLLVITLGSNSQEDFELTENKVKFVSSFEASFHEVCEMAINPNKKPTRR